MSAGLPSPTVKSAVRSLILRQPRMSRSKTLSCFSIPLVRKILNMFPNLLLPSPGFRRFLTTFFFSSGFFLPVISFRTRPKSQTNFIRSFGFAGTLTRTTILSGTERTRMRITARLARVTMTHNYFYPSFFRSPHLCIQVSIHFSIIWGIVSPIFSIALDKPPLIGSILTPCLSTMTMAMGFTQAP